MKNTLTTIASVLFAAGFAALGFSSWVREGGYYFLTQRVERSVEVAPESLRLSVSEGSESAPFKDPPSYEKDAPRYGVRACNHTQLPLVLATAHFEPELEDWLTRGWVPLSPKECAMVLTDVGPPLFVYAETEDGIQRWSGDQVGKGIEFCVHPEEKFYLQREACFDFSSMDFQWKRFFPLELNGKGGVFQLLLE